MSKNSLVAVARPFALVMAALAIASAAILGTATPAAAYDEGTIHSLTNQARAANGLGALKANAAMDQVALNWANQMAANGTMSHNPSYSAQIPGGWSSAGENVAQGFTSGAAVHQGWMNSPGHKANIMGDYTDIGIAHISANGTTWSVEVFGKYGNSAPAPAPAPAPVQAQAPAPAPQPAPEPAPEASPTPEATPTPTATAEADLSKDAAARADARQDARATAEAKALEAENASESRSGASGEADPANDPVFKVSLGIGLASALAAAASGFFRYFRRN